MEILKDNYFLSDLTTTDIIYYSKKIGTITYSDDKEYLILYAKFDGLLYVWHSKDISLSGLKKLKKDLNTVLCRFTVNEVFCNELIFKHFCEQYRQLIIDNYYKDCSGYKKYITYKCENPIYERNVDGFVRNAHFSDLNALIAYEKTTFKNIFNEQIYNTIIDDVYVKFGNENVNDPNFYVWEIDGLPVATARFDYIDGNYAKIGSVFTALEKRNCGYASKIVYELSKLALNIGKIPILQVDCNNITANDVYQSIGYKEAGTMYCLLTKNTPLKKELKWKK